MSQRERRDYRSLGEILADARSERKMTVQEVSEKTKIAPRMITSLENDEIENLSGPVYARGFLRSLCRLYGLDHAWMLSKLEAGLETTSPAPVASVVAPPPPPRATEPEPVEDASSDSGGPSEQTWKIEKVDSARVRRIRTKSRRRIPGRVWGILLALVVLAVLVLLGRSLFGGDSSAWTFLGVHDESTQSVSTQKVPESVSFALASPAAPDTTSSSGRTTPDPTDDPASRAPTPEPSSAEPVRETTLEEEVPVRVVDSAGTDSERGERVLYQDDKSDGLPSVVRPDDRVAAKPSSLQIRATGLVEIWVEVDDGEQYQRTLRAGDEVSYSGFRKFVLDISDNGAVVVELDGIRREPPWRLETPWVLHPKSPTTD